MYLPSFHLPFENPKIDALSGFPKFGSSSILEKCITPLLHFSMHFHLPIKWANEQKLIAATAASGAFIAIRKSVYEESSGHPLVQNEVVEDVVWFRSRLRVFISCCG